MRYTITEAIKISLLVLIGVAILLYKAPAPTISSANETELVRKLDSLLTEKEIIQKHRDSLTLRLDSITLRRQDDSLKIKQLETEITKLRGRYKNVTPDSLGNLMDERARLDNKHTLPNMDESSPL